MKADRPGSTNATATGTHRGRRWAWFAVLTVAVCAAGVLCWPDSVDVPQVVLPHMHPAVAEQLARQRSRVLAHAESGEAWGAYGMLLHQHQRLREALVCFRQAAMLQPTSAKWPYYSAVILEQTNPDEALAHYRDAIQREPDCVVCLLRAAELLLTKGATEQAEELLNRVSAQPVPSARGVLLRTRLARVNRNTTQAEALLEHARRQDICSSELLVEAARVQLLAGNHAAAQQLQNQATKFPTIKLIDSDPWLNALVEFDATGAMSSVQADSMRESGQLREAADLFARLARQFPDRSRPGLNLALTLIEAGSPARAVEQLTALSERFPDDPLIHFHLGFALLQVANIDAAELAMLEAVRLKKDFGIAWAALADIYGRTGRNADALNAFEAATNSNPEDADIQMAFAQFLIQLEQDQRAREILAATKYLVANDQQRMVKWRQMDDQLSSDQAPE